jgi:hypothetical protein
MQSLDAFLSYAQICVNSQPQFVEQLDIKENSLFFGKKSILCKSGDPLDIFFIQNGYFRC